jgi:hypothetical protein
MRTGSIGNRSADDMIRTLIEPKKSVIASTRKKLLERGYVEEVEYDAINIEPVLIYSKSDVKVMFLRHKWETLAQIPLQSISNHNELLGSSEGKLNSFLLTDEEGNQWLKFKLPEYEEKALETLDSVR